jgi:hypothetical protein
MDALVERSGIAKDEIDGLTISSFSLAPDTAVGVTQHLGLSPRWLDHIPTGGASGVMALRRAARAVQAGDADVVAGVAADANHVESFRQMLGGFSQFPWLFSAYLLAQAYFGQRTEHPEKQIPALFYFARAAAYDGPGALDANTRAQIKKTFSSYYKQYHGSPEGENDVLALAKNNGIMPKDFTIVDIGTITQQKALKDQEERAKNPSMTFWMDTKKALTADGGDAYFAERIKDTALPFKFKGKLISMKPAIRPKEIVLAVEKPDVADLTIKLDEGQVLPGKMEPGAEIEVTDGVGTAFTKDPYMLTLTVDKAKITGWVPVKVAPASSSIVSPQLALSSAACKSSPALTAMMLPGVSECAMALCTVTRGSSAGPSKFAFPHAGAIKQARSETMIVRREANATFRRQRGVELVADAKLKSRHHIFRQDHAGGIADLLQFHRRDDLTLRIGLNLLLRSHAKLHRRYTECITYTIATFNNCFTVISIPLRLENPKIGGVDDAEIVGDRIAEDRPVFRYLLAQEMQNRSAELVVGLVAAVVGYVPMHQSP